MKTLGVAVVEVGFWGQNHVRVYNKLSNTELIAVCDVNPERAQTVAEKFGVKGYTYSAKLLKRKDVEAVSICIWSTNLADEAVKALKAGKHVLVEKPMASSIQQAKEILDLAGREERRLMVGFIERFNPGVQRVKDAIHEGRFKDYAQIMLTFRGGKTAFIEANWLTPYKIRSLRATGSEAIMSLNYLTQEITLETEGQTLTPRNQWEEPLKLELQHFASCVSNDKEPLVTGVDGIKALLIAEAALKSAAKCRTIELRHAMRCQ